MPTFNYVPTYFSNKVVLTKFICVAHADLAAAAAFYFAKFR